MSHEQFTHLLKKCAENQEFAKELMDDPLSVLGHYELSPAERDRLLRSVASLRDVTRGPKGIHLIARDLKRSVSLGFSDMSLQELYVLAWAAGDVGANLNPELPIDTRDMEGEFGEFLRKKEQDMRESQSLTKAQLREWAEALLRELDRRQRDAPAQELEDARARVRLLL